MSAAITYTFTNNTPADAAEVNTNFTDLVDFLNNDVVLKDGSVAMTAILTLPGSDPTSSNQATRKAYVDAADTLLRQRSVRSYQSASLSGTVSSSEITLGTVTITDPGYDIYVDGHATCFGVLQSQSAIWGGFTLRTYVDGVLNSQLAVPFSSAQVGTGLSLGVPIRRVGHSTGSNCVVTAKIVRGAGDGVFQVGFVDQTGNDLSVYYTRQ